MNGPQDDVEGIRSTVRAIEGEALDDRAAGFSALHDDLLRMLESADGPAV